MLQEIDVSNDKVRNVILMIILYIISPENLSINLSKTFLNTKE
jgi:hypothetical protein